MDRRTALKLITAGAAFACPTCLSAASAIAAGGSAGHSQAGGEPVHWDYTGAGAPEHWGDLSTANKVCDLGLQQSPVDLAGGLTARLSPIAVNYRPVALHVVNNGHTIQCNCGSGGGIVVDGTRYTLAQFHFHHPSEHLVGGRRYAMELHFVNVTSSGAVAVLGVLLAKGRENPTIRRIWDQMPRGQGQERRNEKISIDPAALLPAERGFYRYLGSLTTPPCSETVTWSVYRTPIEASAAQIDSFSKLFPVNARPVQGMNRRFLLQSF